MTKTETRDVRAIKKDVNAIMKAPSVLISLIFFFTFDQNTFGHHDELFVIFFEYFYMKKVDRYL